MKALPCLWIDATYVNVRQAGRIGSVAIIVAVGVKSDGRREVLGIDIGPRDVEIFWTASCSSCCDAACAASCSSSPTAMRASGWPSR